MQGLADGGLAEGYNIQRRAMAIHKLHDDQVGLCMAFGFPGRRSKAPIQ